MFGNLSCLNGFKMDVMKTSSDERINTWFIGLSTGFVWGDLKWV